MKSILFPALLLCSCGALAQADDADDAFAPDRPGFANGSATVAPGRVIIESGFAQTRDRARDGGAITDDFPEALLRFGVTPNLELQLGAPNYNAMHGGPRGFGDAFVGAKIKVYQRGQTLASVAPGLTVPFGRRDFRSSNVLPSLVLGVDGALGKRADFSANLILSETQQANDASGGGGGTGSGGGSDSTGNQFTVAPAASVSYDLTAKLGVFLDGYAIVPRRGPSESAIDGGFTYLLNNNVQLDLEYGHGLGGGASPRDFYGGGIAVQF